MRGCKICHIDPDSPLRGHAVVGDALVSINGNPIHDVLDYKYFAYDTRLAVELEGENGARRTVHIRKREGGGNARTGPLGVRGLWGCSMLHLHHARCSSSENGRIE